MHFETALADQPERWDLHLNVAACHEQRGDLTAAQEIYTRVWDQAVETEHPGWRAQAAAGLARTQTTQRPESETLRECHRQDPENGPLEYALASALQREGETEPARERFQKLTRTLNSDLMRAGAWFHLAELSQDEERAHCLRDCLKHHPYHNAAHERWASMEACHAPA